MPRSHGRGRRNNNPSGRNHYSDWGVMEMARERPLAAAAAAAGAAAAGLFLWSKREKISNQLSNLSEQINEWADTFRSGDEFAADNSTSTSGRQGMSETGGGNASLGRTSGGGGTTSTASGRGRARSAATS